MKDMGLKLSTNLKCSNPIIMYYLFVFSTHFFSKFVFGGYCRNYLLITRTEPDVLMTYSLYVHISIHQARYIVYTVALFIIKLLDTIRTHCIVDNCFLFQKISLGL